MNANAEEPAGTHQAEFGLALMEPHWERTERVHCWGCRSSPTPPMVNVTGGRLATLAQPPTTFQ